MSTVPSTGLSMSSSAINRAASILPADRLFKVKGRKVMLISKINTLYKTLFFTFSFHFLFCYALLCFSVLCNILLCMNTFFLAKTQDWNRLMVMVCPELLLPNFFFVTFHYYFPPIL